jgi:hypothetical protein
MNATQKIRGARVFGGGLTASLGKTKGGNSSEVLGLVYSSSRPEKSRARTDLLDATQSTSYHGFRRWRFDAMEVDPDKPQRDLPGWEGCGQLAHTALCFVMAATSKSDIERAKGHTGHSWHGLPDVGRMNQSSGGCGGSSGDILEFKSIRKRGIRLTGSDHRIRMIKCTGSARDRRQKLEQHSARCPLDLAS